VLTGRSVVFFPCTHFTPSAPLRISGNAHAVARYRLFSFFHVFPPESSQSRAPLIVNWRSVSLVIDFALRGMSSFLLL